MRCRHTNRRNGHNGGINGGQGMDLNSSATVANSTISSSVFGSCSNHCHPSSLLDSSNPHYGCGCIIANHYPLSLQHHSQMHHQLHQQNPRSYRNIAAAIHPIVERPDFCAWDSCDDR